MKTIEITVAADGQSLVETRGFAGHECRHASQFVEAALGKAVADRPTAEMFRTANSTIAAEQRT